MAETGIMNLSLKIAGGDYDDFYPYELTLEEGFSRVYRAELTVFTSVCREPKGLRELLERNVSITVSQRMGGGQLVRSRYVHGIITGVSSTGLVSAADSGGKKSYCFRHILTIESTLARLRHTSMNSPWYRKTPPEIIETILSRYGIRGEFSDQYINRSNFSANAMFEQTGVSDLDFIRSVMNMYGISWTLVHGRAAQGGLGTAELHFSEGSRFPPPEYAYSDKRKIPEIEHFDFINFDERQNIWKMDGFRAESVIGVDGLEVTALYPQASHGSDKWRQGSVETGKRYHSYNTLFHGYERGTTPEGIDTDMQRIIKARRLAFTIAQENWNGSADNIVIMPGLVFELRSYPSPDSGTVLTALVTDTHLHVRALWPHHLSAPSAEGIPGGTESGELAQVTFSAKNWGRDSDKRFCRIEQGGI